MKKLLLLIVLLLSIISLTYSQNNYYWYKTGKIYLDSDSTVFYLQTNTANASKLNRSTIAAAFGIHDSAMQQLSDSEFTIHSKSKINANALLSQSASLKYSTPLLKNNNATIIVLPHIVVQVKEGHTIEEVLALYKNKLTLIKDHGFNTYLLQCNSKTSKELLNISNALYEKSGIVIWSEPEFYSNYKPTDDPFYPNQYYLHNTGQYGGVAGIDINVVPAWSITTGSNTLRVAVIDEGVENHEDFNGRVLNGYTAGSATGNGAPQNGQKGHGVACAGIIAASHNDLGIKGVAPNVLIVPVNIFPNTPDPNTNPAGAATNDEVAAAIDWAWNQGVADVLSNSWGGGTQSNNIDAAIGRARTQGRGNKGCPVVFASGNFFETHPDVAYPGNLNGVITVGACNNAAPSGAIWHYSQRGASMDLVAPSGEGGLFGDVTTTDRMGAAGYEPGNYTTRFGATSAACPQVAGIAALMLSVNPNLTETQVRTILQNTATDMGTVGFDNTFGYGRANACAAVRSALSLAIYGSNTICTVPNNYTIPNLPAGATVTWSASSGGTVTINSPNSPQTTITRNGDGIIILTASIANICGANLTLTKQITVGVPNFGILANIPCQPGTTVQPIFFNASPVSNAPTTYHWRSVTNGVSTTITGTGSSVSKKLPLGRHQVYAWGQNACGTGVDYEAVVNVNVVSCPSALQLSGSITATPNPTTDNVTVAVKEQKNAPYGNKKKAMMYQIKVTDQLGNVKKQYTYSSGTAITSISLSGFISGMYTIQAFDGASWSSVQVIKQ